jgi:hypothetical protein
MCSDLLRDLQVATGAITIGEGVDALREQRDAAIRIKTAMVNIQMELRDAVRAADARLTADKRLKRGDDHYGVHMRHCYGLDDDPPLGHEGSRFSCKYGEDDICPAAMFEDPWKEYVRQEEEKA